MKPQSSNDEIKHGDKVIALLKTSCTKNTAHTSSQTREESPLSPTWVMTQRNTQYSMKQQVGQIRNKCFAHTPISIDTRYCHQARIASCYGWSDKIRKYNHTDTRTTIRNSHHRGEKDVRHRQSTISINQAKSRSSDYRGLDVDHINPGISDNALSAEDIKNKTQTAQHLAATLGELNPRIVSGEIQPRWRLLHSRSELRTQNPSRLDNSPEN